jgi:hypothetical protein
MVRLLIGLAVVLLSLLGGITTARLWLGFSGPLPGDRTIAGWSILESAASRDASAMYRVIWTRSAFAMMPRERALYFSRTTSENGRDLQGGCRYRIIGTAPTSAWWNLTVYDSTLSAIASEGPGSLNPDNVQLDQQGGFTAYLSGVAEPGNWLSDRTGGTLLVIYRIYEPSAGMLRDPSAIRLPTIVQSGGCA